MVLAHGSPAGLVAEVLFLGVPVAVFFVLSLLARRRRPTGPPPGVDRTAPPEVDP